MFPFNEAPPRLTARGLDVGRLSISTSPNLSELVAWIVMRLVTDSRPSRISSDHLMHVIEPPKEASWLDAARILWILAGKICDAADPTLLPWLLDHAEN